MSIWKVLWALASVGLSFVINQQLRPRMTRDYDTAQHTTATGKLTLQLAGTPADLPVVTMHIVTVDVSHVGKKYAVREISLRAPAAIGEDPRFEIFIALPQGDGVDYGIGVHDPSRLRERPMIVQPSGLLGSRQSYFAIQEPRRDRVTGGKLVLSTVAPFGGDPMHYGYSVQGRLDLEVDSPAGVRMLGGSIEGRIIWDED